MNISGEKFSADSDVANQFRSEINNLMMKENLMVSDCITVIKQC